MIKIILNNIQNFKGSFPFTEKVKCENKRQTFQFLY